MLTAAAKNPVPYRKLPYGTVQYQNVGAKLRVKKNSLKEKYKSSLELPENSPKTVHTAPEAGI